MISEVLTSAISHRQVRSVNCNPELVPPRGRGAVPLIPICQLVIGYRSPNSKGRYRLPGEAVLSSKAKLLRRVQVRANTYGCWRMGAPAGEGYLMGAAQNLWHPGW